MTEKITLEINKEDFFKNWEPEQIANLSDEDKEEIIKFFVNRNICLKRDNYQCQNEFCTQEHNSLLLEERRKYITVHHIIPRRDFKENPQTLMKRLGYGCNDLDNLIVLCKSCHKGYEKAQIAIKINGVEYKLEKSSSVNYKAIIEEGRRLRKELKRLGKVGWHSFTEEQRMELILLLMKWLNGDMLYQMSD